MSDIHLWIESFNENQHLIECLNSLSEDEKIRADSYAFKYLMQEFILCRGTLRKILAQYLKVTPKEIKFSYSEYGKPFVSLSKSSQLYFNISHSSEYFVIAVSECSEIGIDIEFCKKDINLFEVAQEVFTCNEIAKLSKLSEKNQILEFYKMWTIKEAYIKAIGRGFSFNPKLIEIDEHTHSFLSRDLHNHSLQPWYFSQYFYQSDYILSVVHNSPVHYFVLH